VEEPRLRTALFVSAALRMGARDGRYGVVARHGDDDAGGVLVLLRCRDACVVLSQMRGADGRPAWLRATGAEPVTAESAEAYVQRQLRVDPDLWVLEFDGPDLAPPFEARIVT
jgi:hypothetical protein